jgi:cytochrome P450
MVGGLVALRNPEKYFRNRARAASSFSMTMPGLGEVLFAGNAETVRELLAFAPLTFTPPLPNPIEPVVGQGSLILLSGERHRKERARLLSVLRTDRVRNYADAMAQAARDELRKWQPGHLVDMGDAARTA